MSESDNAPRALHPATVALLEAVRDEIAADQALWDATGEHASDEIDDLEQEAADASRLYRDRSEAWVGAGCPDLEPGGRG